MFSAFVCKQEKSSWDCAFMQVPGRVSALLYFLFHLISTYYVSTTTVGRFHREDGEERSVLLAYIIILHKSIQLHTPEHSYCSNMQVNAIEHRPKRAIYGPSIAHQRLMSVSPGILDRRSPLIFFSALDIFLSSK